MTENNKEDVATEDPYVKVILSPKHGYYVQSNVKDMHHQIAMLGCAAVMLETSVISSVNKPLVATPNGMARRIFGR